MGDYNVKNGFKQAQSDGKNAPYINDENVPVEVEFTITAGASNIALIEVQLNDGAGTDMTEVLNFDVWLSDAATGAGLTATTASGAVTVGTPGAVVGTYEAKKALRVQSDATGTFQLSITDTAKTGFYVCVQNPFTGMTEVSTQLQTADYGA